MEGNQKEELNKIPWWKPGVKLFSEVSSWIAIPIIASLIIGKKIDAHYGTQPIIFLIFTGFGFLISSFGIVKTVLKYMKKIEKEEKEEKNNKIIN
jgi:F0F1-type ATP synthase assembly protein I